MIDIANYLQLSPWPIVPETLFWVAAILVAGALAGEYVRRFFGITRIVGYSLAGIGASAMGFALPNGQPDYLLRIIVDVALALLLFELGSRVNLRWLKKNPALMMTSITESTLSFAGVTAALIAMQVDWSIALTLATLVVATSGAVVGRVASELKSEGQVTERMILLTALNTLFAVMAHRLVTGWLYLDVAGDWVRAVSQPLWVFGGSVLLAIILAYAVATVARKLDLRDENSVLMLLGLVVMALVAARSLNLSTLLVPLMAGVLLRNTTERPWVWPRHFGTAGGVLVLMLFVIVGSAWSLQVVMLGGLAAALILAVRLLAKGAAIFALARWSHFSARQSLALTLTLTPISGTTFVLLADLYQQHPGFAMQVLPIGLSAIAIMELLGPLAVQWGLRIAGEQHPSTLSGGQA